MGESKPDPILLTLFANRFMSVAEAMGRSLQKTAISTNIKERLDFSCALFAPDGDLVANAPFIPVHLGSMSFAVKYQMKLLGDNLKEGDVLMTNSPRAGGSHLPDITIITPVFPAATAHSDSSVPAKPIFFTASRGHHADVGGILPGSMPPTSTTLADEGAEIISFKLVRGGHFDTPQLHQYMLDAPARWEGSSGCRNIRDVESDLKAQVAANWKGVQLLHQLIEEYGLETVQEYMAHIRGNAEASVRGLLRRVAGEKGRRLHGKDFLDDGSPIELTVDIDPASGSALFDFTGTGPEVRNNMNAPISVVHSAVIYCLRAMLDSDIPLNAGCLVPVTIRIPPESLLHPSNTAAVCAGNVLTSQRIVDVVLKTFGACAASQGDTNNLTFGEGGKGRDGQAKVGWGYYETIAGGSGATATVPGTSGVHTHMTNTRIGDVEILERRYPVLVRQFGLRQGSAGEGRMRGGEGVVREIEFLKEMQVSILSERRVHRPYGANGGGDGACGLNLWKKQAQAEEADSTAPELSDTGDLVPSKPEPRIINIGGKATVRMGKGDSIVVLTPGGGGWGVQSEEEAEEKREEWEREREAEREGKGVHWAWEPRGSLAERAARQASF
ncbi:Hydantoinase B/oxoprolinase [Dacryopinax primogenitus]|uniref:Hydantoinase B/oxoprolinase n=1 Tax=Dacryopinax primogenitus (strain DJM 731) TaxID=1858805 RepID=M5FX41_DACPD|nr:Hydantoinase B/oxoprolinase [Dacryopinax primogenitus]EJT98041.1 Hydantoinase B/oxoprolinase [Dacryopinax primogenitus]